MVQPPVHAVIVAHPRKNSFTAAVAARYAQAVKALGHAVVMRDLYGLGFDPCLKAQEMPFAPSFAPGADVLEERALLEPCRVFAFIYPLWLNAPPAILKGYLDRVFGFGFAYGDGGHSHVPRLTGRQLVSFSVSGAPTQWLRQSGGLEALQSLFDTYFASLTGLKSLGHFHFGGVTPGASETFIQARLQETEQIVTRLFGRTE